MNPRNSLQSSGIPREAPVNRGRRKLLHRAGIASLAMLPGGLPEWLARLSAETVNKDRRCRSILLLWLNGGPATIDLWDLKPHHPNGGPFREVETATPGIRISEHLPRLAKWTEHLAILRTLTSREGDHTRAMHLLRTGYVPQAAIQFPAFGALVAHEAENPEAALPNFVSIVPTSGMLSVGSGFLGPQVAPLAIGEDAESIQDLVVPDLHLPPGVTSDQQAARLQLLNAREQQFPAGRGSPVVASQQAALTRALRIMQPSAVSAFRWNEESAALQEAYGRNLFGQGCLLARRLIERRVSFVEVTLDGWDTHSNNFGQVKSLGGAVDMAFSALLEDLQQRGLLDSTLIVCTGEFGRTPRINSSAGRDHWSSAWSAVLAGGGLRGGQIVGRTSPDGMQIDDRPIPVPDLQATLATALGIDPRKQNMSNVGRPIRIADPSAKPVREVLP